MFQYKKPHFWADLESMMEGVEILRIFKRQIDLVVILLVEKKVHYRESRGWMAFRVKLRSSRHLGLLSDG